MDVGSCENCGKLTVIIGLIMTETEILLLISCVSDPRDS